MTTPSKPAADSQGEPQVPPTIHVRVDVENMAPGAKVTGVEQHITVSAETAYDVRGYPNPFLGLQSFTFDDRLKYGGRRALVAQTVTQLTAPAAPLSLLFVTGASGSGKSSFAQAGLLPALVAYYGEATKWAVFRPAQNPLAGLGDALWRRLGLPPLAPERLNAQSFADHLRAHTVPAQVNLLVVDQFEELFTSSAAQPRDTFFEILAQLPAFSESHTHVIATLRADYLPDLFDHPALYETAAKRGVNLRAMSMDELSDAIQQPLRAAFPDGQKRFDPDLVAQLAAAAAEDAAYLPLLQVTLEELWTRGSLKLSPNINLTDALKQRADKVLAFADADSPDPRQARTLEDQRAILDILLDLVAVGADDDARRDVRRRRSLAELAANSPERGRLIEDLTQARLLVQTTSADDSRVEVDLIHETLLTNWERLRLAILERRQQLRQRARFEQRFQEWKDQVGDLLDGVSLAEAQALAARGDIALRPAQAQEFLTRSGAQAEAAHQKELADTRHVAEAQRRAARLLRLIVVVLALGVLGSAFGGLFAFQQRDAAVGQSNARATAEAIAVRERDAAQQANAATQAEHQVSEYRRLAAQAISNIHRQFDVALLLGVQAVRTADNGETRDGLLTTLLAKPELLAYLHGHTDFVSAVAFSPNGKLLASAGADNRLVLWDVATHRLLGTMQKDGTRAVTSVAFSPDGTTLAAGNADNTITLWDVTQQPPVGSLLTGHSGIVYSVAFSPDGRTLASGSADKSVILWDLTRQPPIPSTLQVHAGAVAAVAFSPDGRTLALGSADNSVILWDVRAHRQLGLPLVGHSNSVTGVAFSANGTTLASSSQDSTVILWDLTTQQPMSSTLQGPANYVNGVAFSADGKTLAAGSGDGTIILWDVATQQQRGSPLEGHSTYVESVAFSPDGRTLASGGGDSTVILWDTANRQPVASVLDDHTPSIYSVAFSPDANILASGSFDGSIVLWDVAKRQPVGSPLKGHSRIVYSVAFSPDGKLLASGSADKTIVLWDVVNRRRLDPPLLGSTDTVVTVAFSPDGKILASGSLDHSIMLWDVATHLPIGSRLRGHTALVMSVAFSPDGKILASGSADGNIVLWDVATHLTIGSRLQGTEVVSSVAFSPDGKLLASGSYDHRIMLWEVATHLPIGSPLQGRSGFVMSVAFSPDGRVLASANGDYSVSLWDVARQQPIGSPLRVHSDWVYSVAFSPDGKTVASGSADHTVVLWDVSVSSWQARACGIANRNLTRAEWVQYINPDPATYAKICDNLPLPPA